MDSIIDWLGREIKAGDYVVYPTSSHSHARLTIAQVLEFETTDTKGDSLKNNWMAPNGFRIVVHPIEKSFGYGKNRSWGYIKRKVRLTSTGHVTKIDWSPND